MIYFITVSILLILYTFFAWRYFNRAFYFLVFYIPFQLALNPPVAGIDIATGRLMILILFVVVIVKRIFSFCHCEERSHVAQERQWRSGPRMGRRYAPPMRLPRRRALKALLLAMTRESDFIGTLLLIFLFWSGLSIFWSENLFWGFRKWLVFVSIFPLYWVTLYAIKNKISLWPTGPLRQVKGGTSRGLEKLLQIISVSGFFTALAALIQFIGQFIPHLLRAVLSANFFLPAKGAGFIWGGHEVFHFWARNFFPIFLGQKFGETVFWYQSWFVNISGHTLMRAVGFFPDPHMLGFYIGLIFPLALSLFLAYDVFPNWGKHRTFYLLTVFLLFITILLTFSRSAYAGLFAGLLVFFVLWLRLSKKKKKIIIFFAIIVIVLLFIIHRTPIAERFVSSFNLDEVSNSERLENWKEAISIIKKHPVHGTGIGSYSLNAGKLREMDNIDYRVPLYAHNTYLDIWAEMGIAGLLLWLTIFGYIFYKGIFIIFKNNLYDKKDKYLLAGFLSALVWFSVQVFFDTPIFSPRVLPIFIIILAISTKYVGFREPYIKQ